MVLRIFLVWAANSEGPESVSLGNRKNGDVCNIPAQVLVRGFSPHMQGESLRGGQSVLVHILLLMGEGNRLQCLAEGRAEYDGGGK